MRLITEAVEEAYKEAEVEIYGSVSQGLAIESSDMDLCITNVECFDDKAIEKSTLTSFKTVIEKLVPSQALSKVDCITETDFPVLKLSFLTAELESEFGLPPASGIPEVHVDVTINDRSSEGHYGLGCRDYVKSKIELNSDLRLVCLILKRLLQRNGLNEPYTGGLGSYSLFLMLLYAHNQTRGFYAHEDPAIYKAKLLVYFL